jgi:cell division inhibitor SulA
MIGTTFPTIAGPKLGDPALLPDIWRASELAVSRVPTLSSGHPELDQELPNQGWPRSSLVELLLEKSGIGELLLLKPILKNLGRSRRIALIQPPYIPHAKAFQGWGIDVNRLLWMRAQSTGDALWTAEQILKNNSCGAVVLWQNNVRAESLRRLHLAAQAADTHFFYCGRWLDGRKRRRRCYGWVFARLWGAFLFPLSSGAVRPPKKISLYNWRKCQSDDIHFNTIMRFLISLFLPLLPLEALRPCWSEPGKFAVMEHGQVCAVSTLAGDDGVGPGMRQASVAALSPDTSTLERDPAREAEALSALAVAMMRFTPEVAPQPDFGMLLDVGASLRLFGGHRALCKLVRESASRLGFTVCLGAAPTAGGAWMLARSPGARRAARRRCARIATLTRLLDRLGVRSLAAAGPHLDWLRGIGAADLSSLRRLPCPNRPVPSKTISPCSLPLPQQDSN